MQFMNIVRNSVTICIPILLIQICLLTTGCVEKNKDPNIILISIDTLRADHLGCYGYYRRDISPNIDTLCKKGVQFTSAFATRPTTGPSHSSLLSGMYPDNHNCTNNCCKIRDGINWLPSLLKKKGYDTCGIVSIWVLHSKWGFNRGFDDFDDEFMFKDLYMPDGMNMPTEYNAKNALTTTDAAIKFINKRNNKGPFFMFLHYIDPHGPYLPPPPFNRKYTDPYYKGTFNGANNFINDPMQQNPPNKKDIQNMIDLYDGEIAYLDTQIGRFMDFLKEKNMGKNTLIIFTADHGESFEHGFYFQHADVLYNSTIRIPLLFYYPGQLPEGRTINRLIDNTSVLPTLLKLLNMDIPTELDGQAINLHATDNSSHYRNFAYSSVVNDMRTSLVLGKYKYILNNRVTYENNYHGDELYDLSSDPEETLNLIISKNDTGVVLKNSLAAVAAKAKFDLSFFSLNEDLLKIEGVKIKAAEKTVLTEEDKQQLKALGYVQ